MRFRKIKVLSLLISGLFLNGTVFGQILSKIDGVFYGDYAYNVQNHSEEKEDQNAFSIRRYYFTFENNLTQNLKTRFRIESAHDDFGSTEKLTLFVKHAYLEWSGLIPDHKLYIGISETNALKHAEDVWGYRSIEKTALDLYKISASADMGIAIKGDLSGTLHHWLTLMNGTGYGSSEVDKYKKMAYAFWVTPVKGLIIEGYADYEKQDPDKPTFKYAKDFSGSKGYYTVKGFAGYSGQRVRMGVELFQRTNQQSGITDVQVTGSTIVSSQKADVVKSGYSIFGTWVTPIPELKLFGRFDYFDPNTDDQVVTAFANGLVKQGKNDETRLIIAGIDYSPVENLHLMPNFIYQSYTDSEMNADLTARITLYYKFDSGKLVGE